MGTPARAATVAGGGPGAGLPPGPCPAGSRWRRQARVAVGAASLAYLGLAAVGAAAVRLTDEWWSATFLAFAPLWVATLPAAFLLPAAAAFRRRSLPTVLLALALATGPLSGFVFPLPGGPSEPPDRSRFRVLTWNVHYADPGPERLAELIDQMGADVAVFQEWSNVRPVLTGCNSSQPRFNSS